MKVLLRVVYLSGAVLALPVGTLAAAPVPNADVSLGDHSHQTMREPLEVDAPLARPLVPYAATLEAEVGVDAWAGHLRLPESVRSDIWDAQRREREATLRERERARLSTDLTFEAVDALPAPNLQPDPIYDATKGWPLDYRIRDSMPVALSRLLCDALGTDSRSVSRK